MCNIHSHYKGWVNQVFWCFQKQWKPYSWRGLRSLATPTSLQGEWLILLYNPCSLYMKKLGAEIKSDQYCFFREYCKELKLSLNNTQFLLDFSQYIDRNTPDACKWCIFFTLISLLFCMGTGCEVSLLHCEYMSIIIPLTQTMSPKSINFLFYWHFLLLW